MNLDQDAMSDFAENSYDHLFYFITNAVERLENDDNSLEDMTRELYWTYGAKENKRLYRQIQRAVSYLQRAGTQHKRDLQRIYGEIKKSLTAEANQ